LTVCSKEFDPAITLVRSAEGGAFDGGDFGAFECEQFNLFCEQKITRETKDLEGLEALDDGCFTYTFYSDGRYQSIPKEKYQKRYRIAVHDADGKNGTGTFSIRLLELLPPINDKCETALELSPGSVISVATANSTLHEGAYACILADRYYPTPGVWYKVVGTGKIMKVFVKNYSFSAFRGPCSHRTCVIYYESEFATMLGEMHYVFVYPSWWSLLNTIESNLSLIELGKPAHNDVCEQSQPWEGIPIQASLSHATRNDVYTCDGLHVLSSRGLWYSVHGTEGDSIRLQVKKIAGSMVDMFVFNDTCVTMSVPIIGCESTYMVPSQDTARNTPPPRIAKAYWTSKRDVTYLILVHGSGNAEFELKIAVGS
jgi:hypothetical protein